MFTKFFPLSRLTRASLALGTLGLGFTALAPQAVASGGKGFTYGLYGHDPALGIDHVGFDGTGNPYTGDTQCHVKRPILCVDVDGSARPNYVVAAGQEFYQGWVEGHYTTTLPIKGSQILSEADGDKKCAASFGPGWRMAEFHDSVYTAPMDASTNWGTPSQNSVTPWQAGNPHGGHTAGGYGNIRNDTRYWVAVNTTTGNCWNP